MFVAALLFFIGVEFYKFCKRAYFRRRVKAGGDAGGDAESKMFGRYLSMERESDSDKEKV